jgi:hypothetical protein
MAAKGWTAEVGAVTAYIDRQSLWENRNVETYSARLRDNLLNTEVFDSFAEARVLIGRRRQHYDRECDIALPSDGGAGPAILSIQPLESLFVLTCRDPGAVLGDLSFRSLHL